MDKPPINPKIPLNPITPPAPATSLPSPQPIATVPAGLTIKPKWPLKKIFLFSGLGLVVLLIGLAVGAWFWYQSLLSPLSSNQNDHVKIVIPEGSNPGSIGKILEDNKVIRSNQAFGIYTRLGGTQGKLQAGTYRLSPAESTPEIVDHLINGNVDTFNIRFLPGATLKENRKVFTDQGYTDQEINKAFDATYDSPLFATKPAGTDLEGYIYGDTYKFGSGASVEDVLRYTFDSYAKVIKDNDLVAKFKAHNLSLFQGITLASIVQREASGGDEANIAQVFYNRMAAGMALGSDVTYQYIADKTGVPRDPNLDSLYNTRRYPGLPPGPIAVPGLKALLGVANPVSSDYLFFLSGDDNVTYYARTNTEHEQNVTDHCKVKCSTL